MMSDERTCGPNAGNFQISCGLRFEVCTQLLPTLRKSNIYAGSENHSPYVMTDGTSMHASANYENKKIINYAGS
jgi:hypothetical protein